MFTTINEGIRHGLGTMAAVGVIAIAGLGFEFGHAGTLPVGTVEVGTLEPIHLERLVETTLPGIVVTASPLSAEAPAIDVAGPDTRLASTAEAGSGAAG